MKGKKMLNSYFNKSLALSSIIFLVFSGLVFGAEQSAETFDRVNDFELLEEQGLGDINSLKTTINRSIDSKQRGLIDSLLEDDILLIPNSSDDNVGMYDPEDGTFLGLFITGFENFLTPICAITGPDSNIYISDQVADAIFVFDLEGNYLSTYADYSDGLNNIRGIDFRGDHLFVTSGDDYVAEFDGPHSRLTDFINDGSDPFDIMFLEDGRALLSDIQGSSDNVRLYNSDGSLIEQLFSISFPEQIQIDLLDPGAFLNASFSGNQVTNFKLDGSIHQVTPWNSGRGSYRLGNGNLLVTSGDGVFEIEPVTGIIIEQKTMGSARFIELYTADGQVGISDNMPKVPKSISLMQNYPNPFNAVTTIQYNLSEASYVVINIYNLLGRKIETLLDKEQPAGNHQVIWDAGKMSSGVYFYKIQAGISTETKKAILLK